MWSHICSSLIPGEHAVYPGGAGGLVGGLAAGEPFLEDHRVDYDKSGHVGDFVAGLCAEDPGDPGHGAGG